MGLAQILIKFTGPHMTENVVSALALEPDLLVPVEYERGMTEKERGRLNHFFHRRGMPTIVTEPVILERYMEADMETRLERLFEKYRDKKPVVDISGADVMQAMAVGAVLARHQYWAVAVMDIRIRERMFFPLKNAAHLRRVAFPKMSESDFRFLLGDEGTKERRVVLERQDLTKEMAGRIRMLGRFFAEAPVYWKDIAGRLGYAIGDAAEGRCEFILDARQLGIRDSAFEDLRDIGILELYERKGGIVRFRFLNRKTLDLLLHIDRIPLVNIYLLAASAREYGKAACVHDLVLYDYAYITGILRCCPLVLGLYNEEAGVQQMAAFNSLDTRLYDGTARKILVCYQEKGPSEEMRKAAAELQIELIYIGELISKLEPR